MRRLPSLACAALAAAHAATFLGASPLDDEFILYRYAQHLLAGDGLVFNAGERIEGYTQPLWLLILAGARAAGAPFLLATRALGMAAAAGAVYATGRAWQLRFPESRWPAPALLLAALPAFAFHAVAGLGTPLLALCLAAFAAAYVRDEERGRASLAPAVWLGLAGLARPEAALWMPPFLAVEAQRRRLRWAWPALLPLLGWTLFRLAYYGRCLPVTYAVKKLPPALDLAYGARYLWRSTLDTGALVWLALALAAAWARPVALGRALWTAVAGAALHALYVLWVGGDYMTLGRFVLPALPLCLLGGCAAARGLWLRRPRARAAACALALLFPQWTQLGPRREVFELHAANEERWMAVGRALGDRAAPGARVAVSAVGAIGFYSALPIVDMLGMTNDAIARAQPDLEVALKGHHRHDARWVLEQEPDLILIGAGRVIEGTQTVLLFRWEEDLLAQPDFQRYRRMALPVEGSYPLYFFLRPGAPVPRGAVPAG